MNTFFYVLLVMIFLTFPFLFFLYIYNAIEKKARKVIALLPDDVEAKFTDVRIWFKGYDMLKKVNKYSIDTSKSLYSYNLADLYIFSGGIVVVGKIKAYGRIRLLSPFAICWPSGETQLSMVPYRNSYVSAEVVGQDADIKFHDKEYTNCIVLAVKNIGRDLYNKVSCNV
jgi:hypothetical protein